MKHGIAIAEDRRPDIFLSSFIFTERFCLIFTLLLNFNWKKQNHSA